MRTVRSVVAIPVRNEAAYLPACLGGLIHQVGAADHSVLLLINNTDDDSVTVARAIAATSPVPIAIHDVTLPPAQASAGGGRRLAMAMAARGNADVLLTTDADGVVAPDWLFRNLAAIEAGADAVCGRALIEPEDEAALPESLRQADALECQYAALLDELASLIDPDPADPWPRHDEHSGASIAVTAAAFAAVGGIPDMPSAEDRGFIDRLRHIDARIRHAPEVHVTVSGRIEGRAAGGMADTIRRRLVCPDPFLDDRLEPAADRMARLLLRRRARDAWLAGKVDHSLAGEFGLTPEQASVLIGSAHFGATWAALERCSPRLRRRIRVPAALVHQEIATAITCRHAMLHGPSGVEKLFA